jgi:hypothetical protein
VYGPLRAVTGSKTVEVTVNVDTVGTVIEAFISAKIRHTVCQRSRVGALASSMSDGVSAKTTAKRTVEYEVDCEEATADGTDQATDDEN